MKLTMNKPTKSKLLPPLPQFQRTAKKRKLKHGGVKKPENDIMPMQTLDLQRLCMEDHLDGAEPPEEQYTMNDLKCACIPEIVTGDRRPKSEVVTSSLGIPLLSPAQHQITY